MKSQEDLITNVIKIAERLGWLRKYFKDHENIHTNAIIRFLLTRMKAALNNISFEHLKPGMRMFASL